MLQYVHSFYTTHFETFHDPQQEKLVVLFPSECIGSAQLAHQVMHNSVRFLGYGRLCDRVGICVMHIHKVLHMHI